MSTWVYVSSLSISTAGDKTSSLFPGMKIKLAQTTDKYFTIVTVTYVNPNTILTLDGGGIYTVANAVISSVVAIVNDATALGFPIALDNVSTLRPGNCPALPNDASQYLNGLGSWASFDGWLAAGETWTYASADADAKTYTFTISGDKSTKYYPGMKIKLTQTSVKYFFITNVAYGSPNTTITIYGGSDYVLTSDTITLPFYSRDRIPSGFPQDRSKWDITVTDVTNRTKSSPVSGTVYYTDFGSLNIVVPIGLWSLSFQAFFYFECGAHTGYAACALSTATDSITDNELVAGMWSESYGHEIQNYRQKYLNLSSKATYYFVGRSDDSDITEIGSQNLHSTLVIKARCEYL